MEPMLTAAQAGIPVVDGDGMGRAFPEMQMCTWSIYGHKSAPAAMADEKGNILVAITQNNEIWIDKRRIDLKAVRANIERLKIEYPEGSVIIQADKEARSGLLVETMDQIRLAGVQNISIAAKND